MFSDQRRHDSRKIHESVTLGESTEHFTISFRSSPCRNHENVGLM